jgi:hypothetical protein
MRSEMTGISGIDTYEWHLFLKKYDRGWTDFMKVSLGKPIHDIKSVLPCK